jgi:hypothetical protein
LNDQSARIIRIALGILGYIYRSLLGVFSAEFSPAFSTASSIRSGLGFHLWWICCGTFGSRFYSAPAVNITRQANCRAAIFAAISFSWRPRWPPYNRTNGASTANLGLA